MNQAAHFRYRIRFAKGGPMRYTGHLDLQRTWERTLRRARLPLVYSQGYTPRPRINLGAALPLGCTSRAELLDIWLEKPVPAQRLLQCLQPATPLGLAIESIHSVPVSQPALQTMVRSVDYRVGPVTDCSLEALRSRVRVLLKMGEIRRLRRGKAYDLRPLIEDLEVDTDEQGAIFLRMRLSARPSATGRPDEVLYELGIDPALSEMHRTGIHLQPSQAPEK